MRNQKCIFVFIVFLSLFAMISCNKLQEFDMPEAPTVTGAVEFDLDKEIAENYDNCTVSLENVYRLKKIADERWEQFKDKREQLTYYEIVKLLGSTGKNTSELMYRYEWRVDDGRYLHARFWNVAYNQLNVPAETEIGVMYLDNYTLDQQIIESKYKYMAEYLYDSFYKLRYDTYTEFFEWFGYRNIPEIDKRVIEKPNKADYEEVWREYKNVPVDKAKALNIKEGMTLYEVMVRLCSFGESSGSGNCWEWKVDDDFYLFVTVIYKSEMADDLEATIGSIRYDYKEYWERDDFLFESEMIAF